MGGKASKKRDNEGAKNPGVGSGGRLIEKDDVWVGEGGRRVGRKDVIDMTASAAILSRCHPAGVGASLSPSRDTRRI